MDRRLKFSSWTCFGSFIASMSTFIIILFWEPVFEEEAAVLAMLIFLGFALLFIVSLFTTIALLLVRICAESTEDEIFDNIHDDPWIDIGGEG